MKTTNNKGNEAQGAENLTMKYAEETRVPRETNKVEEGIEQYLQETVKEQIKEVIEEQITGVKKERKPNTIYTLKAYKEHIEKLGKHKVATKEEMKTLKEIHRKMVERWIGLTIE